MELLVASKHIDSLHHVNNVQYLQWVQEIAKAHWEKLTESIEDLEGVWVVRNHFIEYKKAAYLGDRLLIETHVKTIRGPLSERFVIIKNAKDNSILAQCTTSWCYIELKSRRLLTVPETVQKLLLGS